MDRVSNSDQDVEASLSTVFQSVCGSKQCWYLRRSEVLCMVRDFGPHTLFLTLSCAEYESLQISNYLRKVNDVLSSFPIGKLCLEGPISVYRKFSQKCHGFFKGGSIGTYCPPLLQEGVSGQRSTTLPHPPPDRRCTNSRY